MFHEYSIHVFPWARPNQFSLRPQLSLTHAPGQGAALGLRPLYAKPKLQTEQRKSIPKEEKEEKRERDESERRE